MPPPTTAPSWKQAWDEALYGERGFFRHQSPGDHFRTSVHASPLFAEALLELCRRSGLDTVVDIGAGRGELLRELQRLDPSLTLLGVEVAPRPGDLPAAIDWSSALPSSVDGLVVANEWLDNIPCHVVEVDPAGVTRVVHVDASTGVETLGARLDDSSVPASLGQWLSRWWPLEAQPGLRAEVGTTRDAAWSDVVSRLVRGVAVAIDYGHVRDRRPAYGSMRSYLRGREVEVAVDGSRDVTAHVAVDAVAQAVDGHVVTQRDALRLLGVSGSRPALDDARSDPAGYLAALSKAGEAAELMDQQGLGDLLWVATEVGVQSPLR